MTFAFALLVFGFLALFIAWLERRQIDKIIRDFHTARKP